MASPCGGGRLFPDPLPSAPARARHGSRTHARSSVRIPRQGTHAHAVVSIALLVALVCLQTHDPSAHGSPQEISSLGHPLKPSWLPAACGAWSAVIHTNVLRNQAQTSGPEPLFPREETVQAFPTLSKPPSSPFVAASYFETFNTVMDEPVPVHKLRREFSFPITPLVAFKCGNRPNPKVQIMVDFSPWEDLEEITLMVLLRSADALARFVECEHPDSASPNDALEPDSLVSESHSDVSSSHGKPSSDPVASAFVNIGADGGQHSPTEHSTQDLAARAAETQAPGQLGRLHSHPLKFKPARSHPLLEPGNWVPTTARQKRGLWYMVAHPSDLEIGRDWKGPTFADLASKWSQVEHMFRVVLRNLRREFLNASLTFGSRNHLVLSYAKLGDLVGVPVVSLAHEDTVGGVLRLCGEWESAQTKLLQSLLQPGDIALDIGAHIGTQTVGLASAVYPHGHVHAFEPQRGVVEVLRANVALAGFGNVIVHHCAVGNSVKDSGLGGASAEGASVSPPGGVATKPAARRTIQVPILDFTLGMHEEKEVLTNDTTPSAADDTSRHANDGKQNVNYGGLALDVNSTRLQPPVAFADPDASQNADSRRGISADSPHAQQPTQQVEEVELVAVDDFGWFAGVSCPKLIKVDVEGMEEQVLLGAERTIVSCQPFLHIENDKGDTSRAVLDLVIRKLNYDCYWEVMRYRDPDNYFGLDLYDSQEASKRKIGIEVSINILCVPRGRYPNGLDDDALPPLLKWIASKMTRVDPDRPLMEDYPEYISVPDWLVPGLQAGLTQPPRSSEPSDNVDGGDAELTQPISLRVAPRHSFYPCNLSHH